MTREQLLDELGYAFVEAAFRRYLTEAENSRETERQGGKLANQEVGPITARGPETRRQGGLADRESGNH